MESARLISYFAISLYVIGTVVQVFALVEAVLDNKVRKESKQNGPLRVVAERAIHLQILLLIINLTIALLIAAGLVFELDENLEQRRLLSLIPVTLIPVVSILLMIARRELRYEVSKILSPGTTTTSPITDTEE